MLANAVFLRHVVIGDAVFRQHDADPDVFAILIGRAALLDHVAAKARTLVDAQNAGNAADHAANDAADHGADRTGGPLTVARASLDAAGDALGLGQRGNGEDGDKRQRFREIGES